MIDRKLKKEVEKFLLSHPDGVSLTQIQKNLNANYFDIKEIIFELNKKYIYLREGFNYSIYAARKKPTTKKPTTEED